MNKPVISIVSAAIGAVAGASAVGKVMFEEKDKANAMSDKHLSLFLMMNQWVKVKQDGKNLTEYFEKNGYRKIAVYGMSYAGKTLIDELKGTGITVAYGIDKKADTIYADIDILSVEDSLADVDAVVVTAITFFNEIKETLTVKMDCPIISLEDVVYEV